MSQHQWCRRVVLRGLVIAACTPVLLAAQGIKEPHAPVANARMDLNQMRTAYAAAYNAKDIKALNAMYASDAVVVGTDGGEISGWAAIAKSNEADAGNWPHMDIESHGLKIYGNTAVDVGTIKLRTADGTESTARYTAVLRHDMHGWKLQNLADVPVAK